MTTNSNPGGSPSGGLLSDDRLIGRQLGDYTLLRVLATGGMARIYEGVDRKLGRTAAVKVLIAEKTNEDDTLTMRFQREASAVSQLEHDNIVTVYQYGEQDGVYFMAMKLVRGKDMAQELGRLRRAGQKMDLGRGLKILEQVAAALDAAHKKGIIHRDVKPSNILIDADDKAYLTDFGLVLRPSTDTTFGTAFGTPRYISPEQAVASNKVSPQSDVYSLAIIMYEVLTGQTPFNGETPMEIALNHIHEPPPPPTTLNPNIPKAVEDELLKALEKTQERRHESAGQFISAIKRAFGFQIDDTPLVPLLPLSKPKPPEGLMDALEAMALRGNPPPKDENLASWDEPRTATSPTPGASPGVVPSAASRAAAPPITDTSPTPSIRTPIVKPSAIIGTERTGAAAKPPKAAAAAPPRQRSPVMIVAVGLAGIALIALIALLPQLGNPFGGFGLGGAVITDEFGMVITAEPTATSTPTPTPIVVTLTLIYDEWSITIHNGGGVALNTTALTITGERQTFHGSQITGSSLPPGTCYRIRASQRSVTLPAVCARLVSENQPPVNDVVTNGFWRGDGDSETSDESFTMEFTGAASGTETVTCNTISRGATGTCTLVITLPEGT